MRRLGIILIVLGLAGFLFPRRASGPATTAWRGSSRPPSPRKSAASGTCWTTRAGFSSAPAIGLVLVLLPGKKQ